MPPATRTHSGPNTPTPHAPDGDNHPDDAKAPADDKLPGGPGLYVLAYGGLVELHTHETAEARYQALTYGSKQHRKAVDADDDAPDLPEGGGSHEINGDDITVYKLGAQVTSF